MSEADDNELAYALAISNAKNNLSTARTWVLLSITADGLPDYQHSIHGPVDLGCMLSMLSTAAGGLTVDFDNALGIGPENEE